MVMDHIDMQVRVCWRCTQTCVLECSSALLYVFKNVLLLYFLPPATVGNDGGFLVLFIRVT